MRYIIRSFCEVNREYVLYNNHNVRESSMEGKEIYSKAHFPHRREHQDFYRLSKHR